MDHILINVNLEFTYPPYPKYKCVGPKPDSFPWNDP